MTHKRYLLYGVIMMIPALLQGASNGLCKVYHHRNANAQTGIELGSVVLYFENKPTMQLLPERVSEDSKSDTAHYTFFLPQAHIQDAACQQMIARLHKTSPGSSYNVQLQAVSNPRPGIKLIVAYDTNRVNFSYDHYEADGQQRGLIFRFYNKELLQKVGAKGTVLLRTAEVKKKPIIVLDCGHGGHDEGAIGCFRIKEKDITASVGRHLAKLLRQEGITVQLTRKQDRYVSLDERTYCGSKYSDALLFVSLHANAAEDDKASGIETYYLDADLLSALQKYNFSNQQQLTMNCASNIDISRNNECSCALLQTDAMPYRDIILPELKYRCEESKKLAQVVHSNLLTTVGEKYPIIDRKVKPYAYQVLIGSLKPSILIELGFITNKEEATLLNNQEYQQLLARAIAKAILAYIKAC